jgi:hypothetical protein
MSNSLKSTGLTTIFSGQNTPTPLNPNFSQRASSSSIPSVYTTKSIKQTSKQDDINLFTALTSLIGLSFNRENHNVLIYNNIVSIIYPLLSHPKLFIVQRVANLLSIITSSLNDEKKVEVIRMGIVESFLLLIYSYISTSSAANVSGTSPSSFFANVFSSKQDCETIHSAKVVILEHVLNTVHNLIQGNAFALDVGMKCGIIPCFLTTLNKFLSLPLVEPPKSKTRSIFLTKSMINADSSDSEAKIPYTIKVVSKIIVNILISIGDCLINIYQTDIFLSSGGLQTLIGIFNRHIRFSCESRTPDLLIKNDGKITYTNDTAGIDMNILKAAVQVIFTIVDFGSMKSQDRNGYLDSFAGGFILFYFILFIYLFSFFC